MNSKELENALSLAKEFLNPAILAAKSSSANKDSAATSIAKIYLKISTNVGKEDLRSVVRKACEHLKALNDAINNPSNQSEQEEDVILPHLVKTSHDLLDIIVIEGLYPSIHPYVGPQQDRRKKSSLYNGYSGGYIELDIVDEIVNDTLHTIAYEHFRKGLSTTVVERHFIDIIAVEIYRTTLQDFNPHIKERAQNNLDEAIKRTSTITLFRTFTALLNSKAPNSFRSSITQRLSMLPLQKHGVEATIEFIAITHSSDQPSSKNSISHETLTKITQILTAVPTTISQNDYFISISPQFEQLLDDPGKPELSQLIGHVITLGILSKKSTGSPGSIGWKLFVDPIHQLFMTSNSTCVQDSTIVAESDLAKSLRRLSAFVSSTQSPSLIGRLIHPIMLPLWGICAYDRSPVASQIWSKAASKLLQTFIQRCGNLKQLLSLSNNIFWDSYHYWTYEAGSEGGIEIRARLNGSIQELEMPSLSKIEHRVTTFTSLISTSTIDGKLLTDFIIELLKPSFKSIHSTRDNPEQLNEGLHTVMEVTRSRILQALMQNYGEFFAQYPENMLNFVDMYVQDFLLSSQLRKSTKMSNKVTLYDIQNIHATEKAKEANLSISSDKDDSIASCLSILGIMVHSGDFQAEKFPQMKSIIHNLEALSSEPLSIALKSSIFSTLTHLKQNSSRTKSESDSSTLSLAQISKSINSIAAPDRRNGINSLQNLISSNSTTLDIPATASLLLSTIETDDDSFVFIAANIALTDLAVRRQSIPYTLRLLAGAFQDARESSNVDARLRLGEALASLLQQTSTTDALTQSSAQRHQIVEAVQNVVQTCLAVASRRGNRTREGLEKKRAERLARMKTREAKRAWGGDVPQLPSDEDSSDEESSRDARKKAWREREGALVQSVITDWSNQGVQEDVRVRTSALAVAGECLEHVPQALQSELLKDVIEVSLKIIHTETGAGKAILRRAAVYLFMSHLKAVDDQSDSIEQFSGEQWLKIEKSLRFVEELDQDDLTKGHAMAVIESLDALRLSRIQKLSQPTQDLSLEGRIKGLDQSFDNPSASKIQEIE